MIQNKNNKFLKILSCVSVFALAFLFAFLPFVKSKHEKSASAYVAPSLDYSNSAFADVIYLPNAGSFDLIYQSNNGLTARNNCSNIGSNIYTFFSGITSISLKENSLFDLPSSWLSTAQSVGMNFQTIENANNMIYNIYNYFGTLPDIYHVFLVFNIASGNSVVYANNLSLIVAGDLYNVNDNNLNNGTLFYAYRNSSNYQPSLIVDLTYLASIRSETLAELCSKDITYGFNYLSSGFGVDVFVNFVCSPFYESSVGLSPIGAGFFYNYYISSSEYDFSLIHSDGSFTLLNYYFSSGNYNFSEYYENLYNDKINEAYLKGYDSGYVNGTLADVDNLVPNSILAFASYPFTLLSGFLNFNLFGFNIYNILLSFITVILIIWLIKRIK